MSEAKIAVAYRFSRDAIKDLRYLRRRLGMPMQTILEGLIKKKARRERNKV